MSKLRMQTSLGVPQACSWLIRCAAWGAQVVLVLAALIAVPIMLLPKPLVLQKRHKARAAQLEQYGRVSPTEDDEEAGNAAEQGALRMAAPAGAHHEEEFDFSEIMVHQVRGGCGTPLCQLSFGKHQLVFA